MASNLSILVATFYRFVSLPDFQSLKQPWLQQGNELGIRGTVLLANEGINGTIAGSDTAVTAMLTYLRSDPRLAMLEAKFSHCQSIPFDRFKIRFKQETVRMGLPGINPQEKVGQYVNPEEWNQLIQDPETMVIDTRNHYETAIGSFKNAITPDTDHFRQFPEWAAKNLPADKQKPIAMCCTGGIRCEKATSLLLEAGFEQVYHLKGGILHYLEAVKPEESLWEGDCFVFDERIALNKKLFPANYSLCAHCQSPVSPKDRQSDDFKENESCPRCFTRPRKGLRKPTEDVSEQEEKHQKNEIPPSM